MHARTCGSTEPMLTLVDKGFTCFLLICPHGAMELLPPPPLKFLESAKANHNSLFLSVFVLFALTDLFVSMTRISLSGANGFRCIMVFSELTQCMNALPTDLVFDSSVASSPNDGFQHHCNLAWARMASWSAN